MLAIWCSPALGNLLGICAEISERGFRRVERSGSRFLSDGRVLLVVTTCSLSLIMLSQGRLQGLHEIYLLWRSDVNQSYRIYHYSHHERIDA
jgi:hypothetical protein